MIVESLSYITINRTNLKQLEEIKTAAFYWVEFHISQYWINLLGFHFFRTKMQTLYTGRKSSGLPVVNRSWTTYKFPVGF
jgi:hypothetical protein